MKLGIKNGNFSTQLLCMLQCGLPVVGSVRAVSLADKEASEDEYFMSDASVWFKVKVLDSVNIDCENREIRWFFVDQKRRSDLCEDRSSRTCTISEVTYLSEDDNRYGHKSDFYEALDTIEEALCAYGQNKSTTKIAYAFQKAIMGVLDVYVLPAIVLTQRDLSSVEIAFQKLGAEIKHIDERLVKGEQRMEGLQNAIEKQNRKFLQKIVDYPGGLSVYSEGYLKLMLNYITKELDTTEKQAETISRESSYCTSEERNDLTVKQLRLMHAKQEVLAILPQVEKKNRGSRLSRFLSKTGLGRRRSSSTSAEIATVQQTHSGMIAQLGKFREEMVTAIDMKVMALKLLEHCRQTLKLLKEGDSICVEESHTEDRTNVPISKRIITIINNPDYDIGFKCSSFVKKVQEMCKCYTDIALDISRAQSQITRTQDKYSPYILMAPNPSMISDPIPIYSTQDNMRENSLYSLLDEGTPVGLPSDKAGVGTYVQIGSMRRYWKARDDDDDNTSTSTLVSMPEENAEEAPEPTGCNAEDTYVTDQASSEISLLRKESTRRQLADTQTQGYSSGYCTCSSVPSSCSMCSHHQVSDQNHSPPPTPSLPQTLGKEKLSFQDGQKQNFIETELAIFNNSVKEHFHQITQSILEELELSSQNYDKVWDMYEEMFYEKAFEDIACVYELCYQRGCKIMFEEAKKLTLPQLDMQRELLSVMLEDTDILSLDEEQYESDPLDQLIEYDDIFEDKTSTVNEETKTDKQENSSNRTQEINASEADKGDPESCENIHSATKENNTQGEKERIKTSTDTEVSALLRPRRSKTFSFPTSSYTDEVESSDQQAVQAAVDVLRRPSIARVRVHNALSHRNTIFVYDRISCFKEIARARSRQIHETEYSRLFSTVSDISTSISDDPETPSTSSTRVRYVKSTILKDTYKQDFVSVTETFQDMLQARTPLQKTYHLRVALQKLEKIAQSKRLQRSLKGVATDMIMDLLILVICNTDIDLAVRLYIHVLFAGSFMARHHENSVHGFSLVTFEGAFKILEDNVAAST